MSRDVVKRIAELVRAGATMTSYLCPACGTILVKLKSGEYYCASCDRPVFVVRKEEEAEVVAELYQVRQVRSAVFRKILEVGDLVGKAQVDELPDLTRTLILLLDAYDRLINIGIRREKEGGGRAEAKS